MCSFYFYRGKLVKILCRRFLILGDALVKILCRRFLILGDVIERLENEIALGLSTRKKVEPWSSELGERLKQAAVSIQTRRTNINTQIRV
jgi:hypothetical protein